MIGDWWINSPPHYPSRTSRWDCIVVMLLKKVTGHSALQGLSHRPLQSLTFNTPWKEFRVGIRNEILRVLGKLAEQALQIIRFSGEIFMSPISCITDSMDMNLNKLWEIVEDREAWRAIDCGVTKSWTQIGDCTTEVSFLIWWFISMKN